jgi:hypothetical protein
MCERESVDQAVSATPWRVGTILDELGRLPMERI